MVDRRSKRIFLEVLVERETWLKISTRKKIQLPLFPFTGFLMIIISFIETQLEAGKIIKTRFTEVLKT